MARSSVVGSFTNSLPSGYVLILDEQRYTLLLPEFFLQSKRNKDGLSGHYANVNRHSSRMDKGMELLNDIVQQVKSAFL